MKLNIQTPTSLIDINRLEGLDTIEMRGDEPVFGVATRTSDAAAERESVAGCPAQSEFAVASSVAAAAQHAHTWRQSSAANTLRP